MSDSASKLASGTTSKIGSETSVLARQLLEIIPPVMQTLAAELRRTGLLLSPSHFGVMVMLHLHTCNLSELAEHQGVSLPTMSSTVSRLEERGWVRRERDDKDRRVVKVRLTGAGREKLEQITEQAESRLTSMLEQLSQERQQKLEAGLKVLNSIFGMAERRDTAGNEDEECS